MKDGRRWESIFPILYEQQSKFYESLKLIFSNRAAMFQNVQTSTVLTGLGERKNIKLGR